MGALHLKAEDFEKEVMLSDLPVLVDFYADWCGPCKMLAPVLDEVAEEVSGRVKVCKVNVDEAQQIAAGFNVMSIPNLVFLKRGEVVDQIAGVLSKDQLLQKIKAIL